MLVLSVWRGFMRIKVRARGLAKGPLSPSYPFGISQTLDMCVAKVINSLGVRFHLHTCYIHLCEAFQLMMALSFENSFSDFSNLQTAPLEENQGNCYSSILRCYILRNPCYLSLGIEEVLPQEE